MTRPLLICRAEDGRVMAKVWRNGRLVVAVDLDDPAALCVLRDLAEAMGEARQQREAPCASLNLLPGAMSEKLTMPPRDLAEVGEGSY